MSCTKQVRLNKHKSAEGFAERKLIIVAYWKENDNGNLTICDVASRFGLHTRTVKKYLNAEGIVARGGERGPGREPVPPRRIELAKRLKAEGESINEIARILNVETGSVAYYLTK